VEHLILHIETATESCSCALSLNNSLLASKTLVGKNVHSDRLLPEVEQLFNEQNYSASDLSALAVSAGPGSYTGLRIGVSTAKGICFAHSIPLISISSLRVIGRGAMEMAPGADYYIAMIDARRDEVYCQLYSNELNEIGQVQALILNEKSFSQYQDKKVVIAGDGAEKAGTLLKESGFNFLEENASKADYMVEDIWQKYLEKEYENIAYFEPFYLKDFVTKKAQTIQNILNDGR